MDKFLEAIEMKTLTSLLLILVILFSINIVVNAQTPTPECQSSTCESNPPVAPFVPDVKGCFAIFVIGGFGTSGLYFERKRKQ